MPIGPARMPLFDHLSELRMRVVRIVVCMVIAICIFYVSAPIMGQLLLIPIAEYLPFNPETGWVETVALDPFEAFATRFEIALFYSVIATSPIILWQLLAFFLPALKPKERKWFLPTFFIGVVLFIFGAVFCYFIILSTTFGWLTDQAMGLGYVEPRMSTYIDIIIKFEIAFGFAFELPLVIFYLVIFDVIPYKKLRQSWRMIYIVLMVLCAFITPDASPVTMLLLFFALIALYELSLLAARIVLSKRIKRQNDELAIEEAEEEPESALDHVS